MASLRRPLRIRGIPLSSWFACCSVGLLLSSFMQKALVTAQPTATFEDLSDQEDGQPICSCSPSKYIFTLDFSLTCPPVNVTRNSGISATFCQISPFGDAASNITDLVPVEVGYVDVLELGQDFDVLTQDNITGTFQDGDTIEYTSLVLNDDFDEATEIPKVIQLNIFAFNQAGEPIVNFFAIAFSNNCDEYPTLIEGESAGWTQFTKLDSPPADLCQAAHLPTETPIETSPPTSSPVKDDTEPSDAPEVTDEPTISPTDVPVTDPTDSPEVDPTDAPEADPTDAPEADPTAAPEADPTDSPTPLVTIPPVHMSMSMDMGMILEEDEFFGGVTHGSMSMSMPMPPLDDDFIMSMSMSMPSMKSMILSIEAEGETRGYKYFRGSNFKSEKMSKVEKSEKSLMVSSMKIPKVDKETKSEKTWKVKSDKSSKLNYKSSKEEKSSKQIPKYEKKGYKAEGYLHAKKEKETKANKEYNHTMRDRRRRLRVHRVD